jgi:hypothetical protein
MLIMEPIANTDVQVNAAITTININTTPTTTKSKITQIVNPSKNENIKMKS